MRIGDWVKRRSRGSSKWHFVESVVASAAITHCGRRLEPMTGNRGLDISDVMPLTREIGQPQLCVRCA